MPCSLELYLRQHSTSRHEIRRTSGNQDLLLAFQVKNMMDPSVITKFKAVEVTVKHHFHCAGLSQLAAVTGSSIPVEWTCPAGTCALEYRENTRNHLKTKPFRQNREDSQQLMVIQEIFVFFLLWSFFGLLLIWPTRSHPASSQYVKWNLSMF